jgi:hypothetical protein
MGQLDRARTDLERGAEMHRRIGADGGEALSLQRLAELALHEGRRDMADDLLDRALQTARESTSASICSTASTARGSTPRPVRRRR